MPNIKSAIKRVDVNSKKNTENRPILSTVKTTLKTINKMIDENRIEEAEKYLPTLMSVLQSAAVKGVISKNSASNKISAVSKRIADIKAGKVVVVIKKDNKTIASEKAKAAKEAKEAKAKAAKEAKEAKKAEEEAAKKAAKKTTKKTAKKED